MTVTTVQEKSLPELDELGCFYLCVYVCVCVCVCVCAIKNSLCLEMLCVFIFKFYSDFWAFNKEHYCMCGT